MKRWNWAKPYEHALRGNLVSLAAGLPFGILLSFLGAYLGSEDGQRTFSFLPEQVRFFTIQVLLYGDTPVPSYGFMGYSNAGILLAAILFIGLCWLLTFVVEGYYYAHKNPQRVRSEIVRKTALANMFSYGLLMLFWFPYSYYTARSSEMLTKTLCSEPSSWSTNCFQLLEKYPEVKDARLQACKRFAITPDSCLKGPNSVNRRISGR